MENVLEIRNLSTYFDNKNTKIQILNDINIDVKKSSIVGLVGESGCGKSMLAMTIMSLLPDKAKILNGSIKLKDKQLVGLDKKEFAQIRGNDISIIFQEPMTSLNPLMTIGKQLTEVLLKHKKISKKDAKEKSIKMLEKVGITDAKRRYNTFPHQLSGGLRQRVMIAMALICEPKLLIADEPTTALDVTIQAQVLLLMKKLCQEIGTSIILISHNMGVIASICDYVYVMYAGRVLEQADVVNLFKNNKHPYTNALLASIPSIENTQDRLSTIKGTVSNFADLGDFCPFYKRCPHAMEKCSKNIPKMYELASLQKVRCFLVDTYSRRN